MTEEQGAIVMAFEERWDTVSEMSLPDILDLIAGYIPNAKYYYEYGYNKKAVDLARVQGKQEEAKGNTLFMIDDDPDVVHWVAFNKKWIPLYNALAKHFPSVLFLQDFVSADMTWEGD